MDTKKSFTLIELLLAMALLSILIVLLLGNFNTTLKRGRDQQRKNDLSQVQKALELYYEENQSYPAFDVISPNPSKKLCKSQLCGGGTTESVYMVKTPKDPSAAYTYKYVYEAVALPSYYYLYSYIENDLDQGSGVSIKGYSTGVKCDAANSTTLCRYYVGSSNAAILTPN